MGAEMLQLPTSARHRVLRRHGTVYNFKMDGITLHESTVRPGARRGGASAAANPPPGLPAPVQVVRDVAGAPSPPAAHSPASGMFYDHFGPDDVPRPASTEQLARTDCIGCDLRHDPSSTNVRVPQENGCGMDESLQSEESRRAAVQKRRCDGFDGGTCDMHGAGTSRISGAAAAGETAAIFGRRGSHPSHRDTTSGPDDVTAASTIVYKFYGRDDLAKRVSAEQLVFMERIVREIQSGTSSTARPRSPLGAQWCASACCRHTSRPQHRAHRRCNASQRADFQHVQLRCVGGSICQSRDAGAAPGLRNFSRRRRSSTCVWRWSPHCL